MENPHRVLEVQKVKRSIHEGTQEEARDAQRRSTERKNCYKTHQVHQTRKHTCYQIIIAVTCHQIIIPMIMQDVDERKYGEIERSYAVSKVKLELAEQKKIYNKMRKWYRPEKKLKTLSQVR